MRTSKAKTYQEIKKEEKFINTLLKILFVVIGFALILSLLNLVSKL
jgi:hypothetical protein